MVRRHEIALVLLVLAILLPTQAFSGEIEEAARTFIVGRISLPHDSASVTLDLPELAKDLGKVASYRFGLYTDRTVAGTVPFKITVTFADGTERTYTATARVRLFKSVAVAARRLRRHEVVDREDIRVETRDITFMSDAYFETRDAVVGKRTRRMINAGTILAASDVEAIPIIERGSDVMVSVVIGAVTVTSKARALEDGSLGDCIVVRDLTTGKRLKVMVVGRGMVVLDRRML